MKDFQINKKKSDFKGVFKGKKQRQFEKLVN